MQWPTPHLPHRNFWPPSNSYRNGIAQAAIRRMLAVKPGDSSAAGEMPSVTPAQPPAPFRALKAPLEKAITPIKFLPDKPRR